MKNKFSLLCTALLLLALLIPTPAYAATNCTFTVSGTTMKLNANCTTDATIFIPNGFTLDGKGRTITGVDPAGDHFRGAVVQNGGATAHVKNLTVTVSALADVCDADADRLRGILFEGASGSIKKNKVLNINQGPSGCQEGNAIEVRNAPFDGTHPATKSVKIEDNLVSAYQKSGIVANGDVYVTVEDNTVTGLGPVNYIAQNGVQLGFGAKGKVEENTVSDNIYSPQTFASGGILLVLAGDGVKVEDNDVDSNDVGIWLNGANFAKVSKNKATGSTFDGIALDDSFGNVQKNLVEKNKVRNNFPGIGLYGAAVMNNLIKSNEAEDNGDGLFVGFGATLNTLQSNKALGNLNDGILVDANSNTISKNKAFGNGILDIENVGLNTYSGNECDTSSGPPVDCPEADDDDDNDLSLSAAREQANTFSPHIAPVPFE